MLTLCRMQVTNQMLSLTGSLLSDPSNPPPEMYAPVPIQSSPSRSPSPTPSMTTPAPPQKRQKNLKQPSQNLQTNGDSAHPPSTAAGTYDPTTIEPVPASTEKEEEPYIADEFLNPRQLKQRRKEQEKAKKEARKARKEQGVLETVQEVGAEQAVDVRIRPVEIEIPGMKRKAEASEKGSEKRKRH